MSEQKLFSINGAADLLERDRATISRAVRAVPADGHDKAGHPKWRMASIVQALNQSGGGASPRMTALADTIEETGAEVTAALEKLRGMSDIAKRRKFAESGALSSIGRLHALFEQCAATLKADRGTFEIAADVVIAEAVTEVMAACDFKIRPEELKEQA